MDRWSFGAVSRSSEDGTVLFTSSSTIPAHDVVRPPRVPGDALCLTASCERLRPTCGYSRLDLDLIRVALDDDHVEQARCSVI